MNRVSTAWRAVALVGVAGLALGACSSTSNNSSSSGTCGNYKIAYLGALTGNSGALGQHMVGGVNLALSEYNANHPDCKVTLAKFDSQGDPTKATPLATQIVNDSHIIGLVGPGFSGESKATGPTFFAAGLPVISPSATNVTLTQQGWTNWHRVIGNDAAQGAADAKFLTSDLNKTAVFVIDDQEDYGKGLADVVRSALGSNMVGTDAVQVGQTDFSATVTKVQAANADAVFYGGYYTEAGLLVKQLRQAGWTGTFMSGDGAEDPNFVKVAGTAADGAYLSAPAAPAPADFNTKYKAVNGEDSGLYSTQSYDATNIFLAALAAGKTSHADINAFINSYSGTGVIGPISFDSNGDIKGSTIYAYQVKNGAIDEANPTPIK